MQKINRPLNLFPIDLLLLSIDNRQRVTSNFLKINMLKIEKMNSLLYQSKIVKKAVFGNLSIGNNKNPPSLKLRRTKKWRFGQMIFGL